MTTIESTSRLDRDAFVGVLDEFRDMGLISPAEIDEVLSMLEPGFTYAEAVGSAHSIHLHFKCPDVDSLPRQRIEAMDTAPTSCTDGYVKYPFTGGINMIFSSIPIAEDDMLPDAALPERCVLDHKGVDLRGSTDDVQRIFDDVPDVATGAGWRHVRQGGDGVPVYCCHTEVSAKHWVYPEVSAGGHLRPIEFAVGDLVLHDSKMGCDLRPIDPAHPRAAEAQAALSACAAGHGPDVPAGTSYYEPADLGKFVEVGNAATDHMQRFWAYYNGVFGQDGALTAREKALIGLAVAHSHQCPYCIDSFTGSCLSNGVDVEQMHEAIHASAALAAGVHLVHGVQMRNSLERHGKL